MIGEEPRELACISPVPFPCRAFEMRARGSLQHREQVPRIAPTDLMASSTSAFPKVLVPYSDRFFSRRRRSNCRRAGSPVCPARDLAFSPFQRSSSPSGGVARYRSVPSNRPIVSESGFPIGASLDQGVFQPLDCRLQRRFLAKRVRSVLDMWLGLVGFSLPSVAVDLCPRDLYGTAEYVEEAVGERPS